MFSQLFRNTSTRRAFEAARRASPSPGPGPSRDPRPTRHALVDFAEEEEEEEAEDDEGEDEEDHDDDDGLLEAHDLDEEDDAGPGDEDGIRRSSMPMLPLFSTPYLDSIPVYGVTHAIRVIVSARAETTLSWDQLRSPQVSQFLVRPMQQQIRAHHFTRATLYALMANCLQFTKEGELHPGNAGTSSTRSKVCELLAIKLLKEYSTRELIDALSYDFYPLQGAPGSGSGGGPGAGRGAPHLTAARTSTLEVAIRASAKHFLAHPLVVQQLEAIWSGAISFHSAADDLHRDQQEPDQYNPDHRHAAAHHLAAVSKRADDVRTPLLSRSRPSAPPRAIAAASAAAAAAAVSTRRSVALYDPRQASLFKLSRLRVPRYRFFLGTLSLAVLIALFMSVLMTRSARITSLELLFWFWSAGFMLDELVGFNEQGFALYIMSFWNIFDLGILVLLIVYYCMRVYGVFLVDPHHWNALAYDVLAANAILLLPRIFSVLDHYRYFSQLLIAFRLMAVDLAAVLVLVLISVSGFYVFFTQSRTDLSGPDVAYRIFQILMGFTPAAWELWPGLGPLEKSIMALFLIISHFVVVTILITVLTNSFTRIASNANEEHQFLFAINTISMVKNDALFSYVAPTNIFAWLLMPLRCCLPLSRFVHMNRLIIKVTHFPLLFCIYAYERFWLAKSMFTPTDLVDHPGGRDRPRAISFADPPVGWPMFGPHGLREESVAGFHKDQALDELFRRSPVLRTQRRHERRRNQNAIRNWMNQHDEPGPPLSTWPTMDGRVTPHQQQQQQPQPHDWAYPGGRFGGAAAAAGRDRPQFRSSRLVSEVRSTASDPADMHSVNGPLPSSRLFRTWADDHHHLGPIDRDLTDPDGDGDDELLTNEEEEEEERTTAEGEGERANGKGINERGRDDGQEHGGGGEEGEEEEDDAYMTTPTAARFNGSDLASHSLSPPSRVGSSRKPPHSRTMSSNTILFNPQVPSLYTRTSSLMSDQESEVRARPTPAAPASTLASALASAAPTATQRRPSPPRRAATRPRPTAVRGMTDTMLPAGGATTAPRPFPRERPQGPPPLLPVPISTSKRRVSPLNMSVTSDGDDDDDMSHLLGPDEDPALGIPSSFQTQMMATLAKKRIFATRRGDEHQNDSSDRMSKLVLARMNKLEQSFEDMIREVREMKVAGGSTAPSSSGEGPSRGRGQSGGGGARPPQLPPAAVAARRKTTPASGGSGSGSESRPASRRSTKEEMTRGGVAQGESCLFDPGTKGEAKDNKVRAGGNDGSVGSATRSSGSL